MASHDPPQDSFPRAPLLPATLRLARAAEVAVPSEALHRRGFIIVKLPPEILEMSARVIETIRPFFAGTNTAKSAYRTPQDGERVLSHPGYLTPSPGWTELFEVRRSKCDPHYRFPPGCEAPCMRLFDELRALAIRWLALLSVHVYGDEHVLPQLATADTGPATMRVIHYDQVPELGAQLQQIEQRSALRREAERTLMAGFPTHTDGSLVTLAPRATLSGLAVRDFADDRWLRLERHMAADEAVLFGGDPLAFCTRHYFPACMHRPDALEMCRSAPSTRMATPLFLYPDSDVIFDSTRVRMELRAPDGAELPPAGRLHERDFRLNVGQCRERWAWKQLPYYAGLVLCRDSDYFPGRDLEGEMVYGDDGQ